MPKLQPNLVGNQAQEDVLKVNPLCEVRGKVQVIKALLVEDISSTVNIRRPIAVRVLLKANIPLAGLVPVGWSLHDKASEKVVWILIWSDILKPF